jgi:type I site-specific restriction endonuclease
MTVGISTRERFLTKDELQLAIQRRTLRKSLATEDVDPVIVERFYQARAIRRVAASTEGRGREGNAERRPFEGRVGVAR